MRWCIALVAGCGFTNGVNGPPTDDARPPLVDAPASTSTVAIDRFSMAETSFTTSLAASHQVGAGDQRLLLVAVSISYAGTNIVSLTYGSTALTRIGFRNAVDDDGRVELWSVTDPPIGTAVVTITLDDADSSAVAGICSFTGAGSLGTLASGVGTTGSPTIALASSPDELVVGWVMWNGGNYSTLTSNTPTERWNERAADIIAAGSTLAGASSTSISWNVVGNYNDYWAAAAIAVKP